MDTVHAERNGYKRLDFSKLNFADEKDLNIDSTEVIPPIQWSESVLSGERQVLIKRQ